MNKRIIGIFLFLLVCLVIGGVLWYTQTARILLPPSTNTSTVRTFAECVERGYPITNTQPPTCTAEGQVFTGPTSTGTPTSTPPTSTSSVQVVSPSPNSIVRSPVTIIGQAPGTWFFEASMPVRIVDAAGRIIGQGVAQAESDWMTTSSVPFHAVITFTNTPSTANGVLTIEKDNPSGLPQYDAYVDIPVRFDRSGKIHVQAFFYNPRLDPTGGLDCTTVSPVGRSVTTTPALAEAALRELLRGPTGEETAAGFETSMNSGTELKSITIRNGVATADFTDTLDAAIGGSCRVGRIRSQIESTLKQFPTVRSVVISRNGSTEDVLQP